MGWLRSLRTGSVVFVWWLGSAGPLPAQASQPASQTAEEVAKKLREDRRMFQSAEFITTKPWQYIFNAGAPPKFVWRDVEEIERVGGSAKLRVRWFDADLNEADVPKKAGRWAAIIESTAPNGTLMRRAITCWCRAPGYFIYMPQDLKVDLPQKSAPVAENVWREHKKEADQVGRDLLMRAMNDSEATAILFAGLNEAKPLGRPALTTESAAVANETFHLALKVKLYGMGDRLKKLAPPKPCATPAPKIREGSPSEAGFKPGAKAALDTIQREWAKDSGEPFVTLIARHGVIVTHEAFGSDTEGKPIDRDYRADVASITKTSTAMLFARFLDQGLLDLDQPVGTVFPDWPGDPKHVPTFRQCLTHMSGLTGHGDWGGVRNAYLDNIILNGVDLNEPGKRYEYSGMGFDLTAEAMELITGVTAAKLYREALYEPLEMGDVPMGSASAGTQFTARELAAIAQLMANRGSYGDRKLFSEATFEKLLPEDLNKRYPGATKEIEGIGNHFMHDVKPGKPPGSLKREDRYFSPRTIGHGSLNSCILRVDLETGLIIVQVRRTAGPRFGEWQGKLFQAIVENMEKTPRRESKPTRRQEKKERRRVGEGETRRGRDLREGEVNSGRIPSESVRDE